MFKLLLQVIDDYVGDSGTFAYNRLKLSPSRWWNKQCKASGSNIDGAAAVAAGIHELVIVLEIK